jgi:hypothetical protein
MERFAEWLRFVVYPLCIIGGRVCFLLWIFVFGPMLICRRTRLLAAVGFLYSSMVTGFACWVICFLVTYKLLGTFWTVAGLLFGGVGVVPLAVVGTLFYGVWSSLLDVFFAIGTVIIPRTIAGWAVKSCERSGG